MTENKKTVERYVDGFRKSDQEQILSCLTDDVEWEMPGAFHLVGKRAFDKEIAWLVLMPLDVIRFHWSRMPIWLQVLGGVILLGSFYLFFLTFRENPYLSPAVRVQTERGQTVISTGPYHYVRYPMYAAVIPFTVATTLLLGSWYGLLFGLILIAAIAFRAVREESVLRAELPGYDTYMAQVKYRLIPYVW